MIRLNGRLMRKKLGATLKDIADNGEKLERLENEGPDNERGDS